MFTIFISGAKYYQCFSLSLILSFSHPLSMPRHGSMCILTNWSASVYTCVTQHNVSVCVCTCECAITAWHIVCVTRSRHVSPARVVSVSYDTFVSYDTYVLIHLALVSNTVLIIASYAGKIRSYIRLIVRIHDLLWVFTIYCEYLRWIVSIYD